MRSWCRTCCCDWPFARILGRCVEVRMEGSVFLALNEYCVCVCMCVWGNVKERKALLNDDFMREVQKKNGS